MIASNFSKIFALFFLIIISFVLIFKIQFSYENCNGYAFGDWLINYQDGGFKRRGLLGTIIFFIYENFHINIKYTAFFFQFSCNFFFFLYLTKLILLKKHNIVEYVLLFTPFCLWGVFSDCAIGTRKDGVLWFLMAFFAYNLASGKFRGIREYFFYFLLFVSVFVHESFIFYAPNFIVLYWFHSKNLNYKKQISLLISLYIPALIIFLLGDNNLGRDYTLNSIKNSGVVLQEQDNIFAWKEGSLMKIDFYLQSLSENLLYILSFTFQVLFVAWYMMLRNIKSYIKKKIFLSFLICLLLGIPLYLIAIDLGRWLYSHFIFLCILIISLLPKCESSNHNIFHLSRKEILFILIIGLANIVYRVPSYYLGIQLGLPLKKIIDYL